MRVGDYHIRETCRLCDARLPDERVLDLGSTPLANEFPSAPIPGGQDVFPLYLVQCAACGHVQLPVVVDPKRLFPPTYPYQSGTSPVFRAHLKEFAKTVSGMIPKGGKVLEIASNDGTLLKAFSALGHRAHGIDPADTCDAPRPTAYELLGIEPMRADAIRITKAFFTREWAHSQRIAARAPGDFPYFSAIVALNVFAHVDDLNDFTAGVAELLAPDGVFVFEVGYLDDVLRQANLGVIYHEHVSIHSLWPLVDFFRRHGLTVFDAERIDQQGGSVRVFCSKSSRAMTKRLRQLLRDEPEYTTHYIERVLSRGNHPGCARMVDRVGRIRALRAAGKTVAAFGAPAKLTTWAYALGMKSDDICAVYDDNPNKIGKVTPGLFWPIVPSSRLLEDNPDAVVLFSSNFADEIRERFAAYRGEWIVV